MRLHTKKTDKPLPRRPENRRFVGAAYPSRAAAHNAEGATGTTPTHVKDTPAANGDAP
jgi:hypothetical protein